MPQKPTLTKLLTFAAVAICMSAGAADARPSTKSYTCSALKNLIAQRGAIVMNHKSPSLYQRFVANRSFCSRTEITKRFSVPTKSGKCGLKICFERDFLFDR